MHPSEENLWDYFHNELTADNKESIENHLSGCDQCKEKYNLLIKDEKFFQNMDFPHPPKGFATKIVDKVVRRKEKVEKLWVSTFKVALYLSLLVLVGALIWIMDSFTMDITPYYSSIIWYGIPVIFLVLMTKYFDQKKLEH
jgi:hypothetical protein